MIQLTLSGITIFSGNPYKGQKNLRNLKHKERKEAFSKNSRKRLLFKLREWMLSECYYLEKGELKEKPKKSRLTFLTVTLPMPQIHTDETIKKVILNNFLNKLRYYKKDLKYIWRAESQKNQNIHFHLIMNLYIDKKICDRLWHDSLELLGYITSYYNKKKSRYPPTNRIEYVYTARKIVGYATKYITKRIEYRNITGRNWYASQSLNASVKGETHISREWENSMMQELRNLGLYCAENDFATKFYFNSSEDIKKLPPNIRNMYNELMQFRKAYELCPEAYDKKFEVAGLSELNYIRKERGLMPYTDTVINILDRRLSATQMNLFKVT